MQRIDPKEWTSKPENIFHLELPEHWVCHIDEYQKGHGIMTLSVIKDKQTRKFMFTGVDYFEGEMRWKGANFRVSSDEDCLVLLRTLHSTQNLSEENLLEMPKRHFLFIVRTEHRLVKILAEQVFF